MVRIIDYIDLHDRVHLQPYHRKRGPEGGAIGCAHSGKAYACLGCEVQCGCCLDFAAEIIEDERADLLKVDAAAA